jgi:hypothetical protein
MAMTADKIAQMELALSEAKAEYEREKGKMFDIVMREISPEEKQRILSNLTSKQERILFGLEAPEAHVRPAKSGGDLSCPICGKSGLTPKGLGLHKTRVHKGEQAPSQPESADMFATGGLSRGRHPKGRGEATSESE